MTIAIVLPALALGLSACSAKSTPPGPTNVSTASPGGTGGGTGGGSPTKGCSGGSPATSQSIMIKGFTFLQCPDTVSPGSTVTVHNVDAVTHTFTAINPSGAFNTGDIAGGATKTFKAPTKAGTYYYDCTIHPFMLGALVVS
ncbi:MAG: cupredoxin domain-containing protein [Acidimicrobiales bacterium]